MPQRKAVPTSRLLYSTLAQVRPDLDKTFLPAVNEISRLLTSAGEIIPVSQLGSIQAQAGRIIMALFVGPDGRNPFASDGITPLAPYPAMLNRQLAIVQGRVVQEHAKLMQRYLPDDVYKWLKAARPPLKEMRLAYPPLYDPAHFWVDPKGYRLSDRIWQNGERTRARVDALLAEGIRTGRSSTQIAKDLEAFLLPSRTYRRTNMPYGRDGSFDAMRLARTEITRAHSAMSRAAAISNPFVDGWDWALSARHPKIDICDDLATIAMDGSRIKEPYPMNVPLPIPVDDSHPQCLCNGRGVVIQNPASIVADLRQMMNSGQPAPMTPASSGFLSDLLGGILAGYFFSYLFMQDLFRGKTPYLPDYTGMEA